MMSPSGPSATVDAFNVLVATSRTFETGVFSILFGEPPWALLPLISAAGSAGRLETTLVALVAIAAGAAVVAGIAGFSSTAGLLAARAASGLLFLAAPAPDAPTGEALRAVLFFGLATSRADEDFAGTAGFCAAGLRVVPAVFAAVFFAALFLAVVVTEAFIFPCPRPDELPGLVRVLWSIAATLIARPPF